MSVFALEDENDFAAYLDPNYGHGITVTYTRYGSESSSSINIILNEEYLEQEGESIGIEGTTPVAYCRSIDVPNAGFLDIIVAPVKKDLDGNEIKGETTYHVVRVEVDRTGFTILILEEQ